MDDGCGCVGLCREYTLPGNGENSFDGSEDTRKLDQYWKSRSRTIRINMELKSELVSVDCHFQRDEYTRGRTLRRTWRICLLRRDRYGHTIVVSIYQQKWKDIPAVDYVDKGSLSYRVSKVMTKILRHNESYREYDGAIDWHTLLPMLCLDYECANTWKWTNPEWLNLLHTGCDRQRFQYWLNSDCLIDYIRVIQDHSGGTKDDPSMLVNVVISYKWSEYFYHVGCSL